MITTLGEFAHLHLEKYRIGGKMCNTAIYAEQKVDRQSSPHEIADAEKDCFHDDGVPLTLSGCYTGAQRNPNPNPKKKGSWHSRSSPQTHAPVRASPCPSLAESAECMFSRVVWLSSKSDSSNPYWLSLSHPCKRGSSSHNMPAQCPSQGGTFVMPQQLLQGFPWVLYEPTNPAFI